MGTELSEEERRFVRELLDWEQAHRSTGWFTTNVFLFLGGAVVVAVALFTVQHLSDKTALWITAPGALVGLVFFVFHLVEERRVKERRLVASVLRKLQGAAEA